MQEDDVGRGQYSIHVWLIYQSWHIYLSSLHNVNYLHNKVPILKVYTWMPQNKDTWFQEKAIPLPSFVNNVVWRGRSANQSCKCDFDIDTEDDDDCDDGQGGYDFLQD